MKATNRSNLGPTAMLGVAPGGSRGRESEGKAPWSPGCCPLRAASAWNR